VSQNQATETITKQVSQMFGNALKELLEAKHLYQKVTIKNVEEYWEQLRNRYPTEKSAQTVSRLEADFSFDSCKLGKEVYYEHGLEGDTYHLTILLKNVKMFCGVCDDREPFVAVVYHDLDEHLAKKNLRQIAFPPGAQVILLTYECQHCHEDRISVIVHRLGWDLALHGRSPMEDDKLLEVALEAIEQHFDIRRVHKIPETAPKHHSVTKIHS
jgi:hypothetical protein